MKDRFKKFLKSKIFIFIITALLFSVVGVSAATYFESGAVTYDNTESGLTSTNVQGAIDELYVKAQQTSGGSDDKVEDMGGTTTSGNGIYRDLYESGRYIYKGANPNNYITFNNEQWRIISLEKDGTMKIMRVASIGNRAYDSSNLNDWATSDLKAYLNGTYYNGLSSTAKSQIVEHDFAAGAGYWNKSTTELSDLTDQVNAENEQLVKQKVGLATTTNAENEQLVKQKVGLATTTEYLRSNSNTNFCRTIAINNQYASTCKSTNWMFNSATWWTMSASTYGTGSVFSVYSDGNLGGGNVLNSSGVRPAVYLSSSVKLSGSGTSSNPYTIS